MDNTSCEEKCPWVKSGFCNKVEECPNHVESWWTEGLTGQQKLVRDCVPKRLMIQMMHLQSRFEGVQAAAEEARNVSTDINAHFQELVRLSQMSIAEQEKNAIEQKAVLKIEKSD